MKNIKQLEKNLGIEFKNKDLLIQALTHRSYLNEHPEFPYNNNERLEFLGDAVLEIIVTEYLFKKYNNAEGELTAWRASLVNTKMLSDLAQNLDLNNFILLSKGEAKDSKSKARQSILANAFEAVIGAIYLDRGIKTASEFVEKHLLSKLKHILKNKLYLDAKTKFQEIAQDKLSITPNYKVLKEWGPAHAKNFEIGVYLDKKIIARGKGTSKQEGEMEAATKALKIKKW